MRIGNNCYYLLSDHPSNTPRASLGSTAITANSAGVKPGELSYRAWGEQRYAWGTTYSKRHFMGQIETSSIGLYFFNAGWVDVSLGRFTQVDTIIPEPGDPQAWDRFAYVFNSPVRYTDPSGHNICDEEGNCWDHGQCVPGLRFGKPPGASGRRYEVSEYETNLLTIAIYAESQNYTWPDEGAIEMIGWVYLNRITVWNYTLLSAIAGCQCGACMKLSIDLSDEIGVSNYIAIALYGEEHGNGWKGAKDMAESVAEKWKIHGTGSDADPTNGGTFFAVYKPNEWEEILAKYELVASHYPTFNYVNSNIFTWDGLDRMVITRTDYPPGFE